MVVVTLIFIWTNKGSGSQSNTQRAQTWHSWQGFAATFITYIHTSICLFVLKNITLTLPVLKLDGKTLRTILNEERKLVIVP